jgi:hypothetical protein
MRQTVTLYLPSGYKDADDFFRDCDGFEPVKWVPVRAYDMRRPSRPDYLDGLQVTVCRRSLFERIRAAIWLLFQDWH